jgi:hypothetical protein
MAGVLRGGVTSKDHWPPLHHRTHAVQAVHALLFLKQQQTHKRPCTLLDRGLARCSNRALVQQLRATVNPCTRSTRRWWDQVRKRRLHSSQVHASPQSHSSSQVNEPLILLQTLSTPDSRRTAASDRASLWSHQSTSRRHDVAGRGFSPRAPRRSGPATCLRGQVAAREIGPSRILRQAY